MIVHGTHTAYPEGSMALVKIIPRDRLATAREIINGGDRAERGVGAPLPPVSSGQSGLYVGQEAHETKRSCYEDSKGIHQDLWGSSRRVFVQHLARMG